MLKNLQVGNLAQRYTFVMFSPIENIAGHMAVCRRYFKNVQYATWVKTGLQFLTPRPNIMMRNALEHIIICVQRESVDWRGYNFTREVSRVNTLFYDIPALHLGFNRKALNPTQKPVPLMRYFVEHFTLPGDHVVDLCSGTGAILFSFKEGGL